MMRKTLFAAALALLVAPSVTAQSIAPDLTLHGSDGDSKLPAEWTSDLAFVPGSTPGVSMARIVGAPNLPGVFVIRIRMQPGAVIPPHTHPDAHVTTVLSGTLYNGTGTVADRSHATPVGPGGGYFTPASMPHFVMAGDAPVTYEELGYGPTRFDRVGAAVAR